MTREEILNQMEELKKQLKELDNIEKTNDFIRLLRETLLDDNCAIILQGYNDWQFQEKYPMKDINYKYRQAIAKSLQEIIKDK